MKKLVILVFGLSFLACNEDDQVDLSLYNSNLSIIENLSNGVSVLDILNENNNDSSLLYGLEYFGGYIFYVDENDGSLIVATDYSEIGDVAWGDVFSLDTSAEIGSGDQNTHNIVQGNLSDNSIDGFEFGSDNYAFKIVTELEYNGYSDWFIPSSGSMAVIFDHVHSRGMGNFDESLFYWSSTKQGYNPYVMAFNLDWGGEAFFGSCVDVNGLLIARKVSN